MANQGIPTCSICFEPLHNDLLAVTCGHTFHTLCLQRSAELDKHCPICRASFEWEERRHAVHGVIKLFLGTDGETGEDEDVMEIPADLPVRMCGVNINTSNTTTTNNNGHGLAEGAALVQLLQLEVQRLQEEVERLLTQVETTEQELDDQQTQSIHVLDQLASKTQLAEQLTRTVEGKQADLDALRKKLAEAEADCDRLADEGRQLRALNRVHEGTAKGKHLKLLDKAALEPPESKEDRPVYLINKGLLVQQHRLKQQVQDLTAELQGQQRTLDTLRSDNTRLAAQNNRLRKQAASESGSRATVQHSSPGGMVRAKGVGGATGGGGGGGGVVSSRHALLAPRRLTRPAEGNILLDDGEQGGGEVQGITVSANGTSSWPGDDAAQRHVRHGGKRKLALFGAPTAGADAGLTRPLVTNLSPPSIKLAMGVPKRKATVQVPPQPQADEDSDLDTLFGARRRPVKGSLLRVKGSDGLGKRFSAAATAARRSSLLKPKRK